MNRHDYRAHVAWSDSIRATRRATDPTPPAPPSARVRHANRASLAHARAPRRWSAAVAVLAVLL